MEILRIIFCLILSSFNGLAIGDLSLPVKKDNAQHSSEAVSENLIEDPQDRENLYFYNKGIQLLKEGKEPSALPFFQKSFYQYLFFPAYKVLIHLNHPPVLWPFLWQAAAVLYALFSLIWLLILLKKTSSLTPLLLKGVIFWFSGVAVLALLGFFSLQKRAGALVDIEGRSAPFQEAVVLWTAPAGSDVIVLENRDQWVQTRMSTGQKGWVKAKNLLFTLE